ATEVVELGAGRVQLSASAGVTLYPQTEAVDADQLMRQADQAMYQAKLAGRNRYHFFDPEQDRNLRGHHESIDQIRHALEAGEFVLHYQPRVNLHSGAVVGAEALIRWQHPTRGLLAPAHFLPVIENHPLAVDVGDWVINTALSQVERWREQGLDLPVSVNVSARQLQQPDFVGQLRAMLAAHPGAGASHLELEILETSALQDVNQVSQLLSACAELGVTCSLDDFGTGYSSLSYLKRLPAQVLKIDQSFVRDMLHDPDDLAILEGVLGLATAFHRQAVAEGMETVEHGVMLLQLGCRLAQGYGIARPMPAEQMPDWVRTWQPDPRWARTRTLGPHELPILYAGIEHRAWVAAMDACLEGRRQAPPEMAHERCRFSEWLARVATEDEDEAGREALGAIDLLHRRVHSLAEDMLTLRAARRGAEALALADQLHQLRDALLMHLEALLQTR
ncbi:MAG: EAL domain-containing protein, partial [Vitreoscilla sp.]|nr:EAL domain-containing protein [Vitreoscilla sp.]MBP6676070.1 EAL domain-containing protein [Vitreoscilla sp.]